MCCFLSTPSVPVFLLSPWLGFIRCFLSLFRHSFTFCLCFIVLAAVCHFLSVCQSSASLSVVCLLFCSAGELSIRVQLCLLFVLPSFLASILTLFPSSSIVIFPCVRSVFSFASCFLHPFNLSLVLSFCFARILCLSLSAVWFLFPGRCIHLYIYLPIYLSIYPSIWSIYLSTPCVFGSMYSNCSVL